MIKKPRSSILSSAASGLLLSATLAGGVAGLAQEPVPSSGELPEADCVRMLREARIARRSGNEEAELPRLRAALEAFPGEIAAVEALLAYHRRSPLAADEHRKLQDMLRLRLANRERPLPYGALERIARDWITGPETLELIHAELEARNSPETPDAELLRILARIQLRQDRKEEALETMERLLELTDSDRLFWSVVDLNYELERWPRLIELLRPRMEGPVSSFMRDAYVGAVSRAGDVEDLKPLLESLMASVQDVQIGSSIQGTFETLYDAAWLLRDRGLDVEAEDLFRRLLEIAPQHPELRAVILHLYGSADEVEAHSDALAQRWDTESDPQALFDEGTQRLTNGDAEGALDLLRRAAPGFPQLEAAWYNYGMAAYRLEDWEAVAEAFARAVELNPQRVESFLYLGISLHNLDRCPDALGALEKTLSLDESQTNAHYYLSTCYKKLGDREAAARHMSAYRAGRGS